MPPPSLPGRPMPIGSLPDALCLLAACRPPDAYWQLAGRPMPIGALPCLLQLPERPPPKIAASPTRPRTLPEAFSAKPYLALSLIRAFTKPHTFTVKR